MRSFKLEQSLESVMVESPVSNHSPRIQLDLGCGPTKPNGFIGVDRFALPRVDIVANLDCSLPFRDDSVDLLFASHSLEHVSDLMAVIKEIYRVCKHGAQVCIVAPYYQQGLNLANPYHTQVFNEHTPRFWTTSPVSGIPEKEFIHPHAVQWGLGESDSSNLEIDFRCLQIEFFYFPEYRNLSSDEQRQARGKFLDVCDQIMYHLLVIKNPIGEAEMTELVEETALYEPPFVIIRRLQEQLAEKEHVLGELRQTLAEQQRAIADMQQALGTCEAENARLAEVSSRLTEISSRLTQMEHQYAVLELKSKGLAAEVHAFRERKVIQWLAHFNQGKDLRDDISPAFQQLKDDSMLFTQDLKGFRLQPSVNLQSVPFLSYSLQVNRAKLKGILLAPILDLPLTHGILGVEIVSPSNSIVAQIVVPFHQIDEKHPTHFSFPAILDSRQGRFCLRVFVRNVDVPVRIFEWRKYRFGGFGQLKTRAFCGLVFE